MAFTIVDASGPDNQRKDQRGTRQVRGQPDTSRSPRRDPALRQDQRAIHPREFSRLEREPDWGDITFMTEHDKDIAKIAVVGDEEWRDIDLRLSRQRVSPSGQSNISFRRSGKSARLARHGRCKISRRNSRRAFPPL